ncbi:hypothetical protein K438DRAFT_2139027 [Mycena galopus ATCC 62051]|nr:hypothetical protein K438DRAFT_2139027 [Mycena galopus ATCC 62051]
MALDTLSHRGIDAWLQDSEGRKFKLGPPAVEGNQITTVIKMGVYQVRVVQDWSTSAKRPNRSIPWNGVTKALPLVVQGKGGFVQTSRIASHYMADNGIQTQHRSSAGRYELPLDSNSWLWTPRKGRNRNQFHLPSLGAALISSTTDIIVLEIKRLRKPPTETFRSDKDKPGIILHNTSVDFLDKGEAADVIFRFDFKPEDGLVEIGEKPMCPTEDKNPDSSSSSRSSRRRTRQEAPPLKTPRPRPSWSSDLSDLSSSGSDSEDVPLRVWVAKNKKPVQVDNMIVRSSGLGGEGTTLNNLESLLRKRGVELRIPDLRLQRQAEMLAQDEQESHQLDQNPQQSTSRLHVESSILSAAPRNNLLLQLFPRFNLFTSLIPNGQSSTFKLLPIANQILKIILEVMGFEHGIDAWLQDPNGKRLALGAPILDGKSITTIVEVESRKSYFVDWSFVTLEIRRLRKPLKKNACLDQSSPGSVLWSTDIDLLDREGQPDIILRFEFKAKGTPVSNSRKIPARNRQRRDEIERHYKSTAHWMEYRPSLTMSMPFWENERPSWTSSEMLKRFEPQLAKKEKRARREELVRTVQKENQLQAEILARDKRETEQLDKHQIPVALVERLL